MVDIPLPRLLNSSGVFIRRVRPLKVSIEETIVPLSSASIQLPEDESLPARYFMELFTPNGSAGIYRIRSPQNAYGEDISVAELEHAIVEVGDYLVREKISAMMTPQAALQRIFTNHYRGSRWQLSGNLSALGNTQVAVRVNYDNILTAILSIIEQIPSCYMTFDFSTSPRWTVGFASRGTTVSAEGRLSRNVQSAKITYDDSELCTKAYYEVEITNASGEPDTEWRSLESDYMGRYGTVEREVSISAGATEAEALKTAQEYLRKHEKPRVSIEISGQELSHITGEQLDTFRIGKLFRLAMVDYDLTVEDVITGLIWDDVYGKPTEVTVRLADEEDTAVSFIHDLDSSGGRSVGGGGGRKQQDDSVKEYYTRIQQTDYLIDLQAVHVDKHNRILEQAGMYLDRNGVLIYSEDNVNNIGSKFKVQANRISAVVDGNGNVKPAAIEAAITDENGYLSSNIKLSADKLYLDGDTTINGVLEVQNGIGYFPNGLVVGENTIIGRSGGVISSEFKVRYQGIGSTVAFNVTNVEKSGNDLIITYVDRTQVTFSKAVTLNGAWSNGTYTVTPSAGNPISTEIVYLQNDGAVTNNNNGTVQQKMNVLYAGPGEQMYPTGASLTAIIDASKAKNVIDMPTAQIYTTSGSTPGTYASTLETRIRQAIADGDHVVFRIDCGGSQKYYHMF